VFVLKSLGILTLQPRTRAALGRVRSSERSAHMGCGQALTAATMPESAGVAMGASMFRGPAGKQGSLDRRYRQDIRMFQRNKIFCSTRWVANSYKEMDFGPRISMFAPTDDI
jgi:hypothetical protein